jgi:hypothetical protein
VFSLDCGTLGGGAVRMVALVLVVLFLLFVLCEHFKLPFGSANNANLVLGQPLDGRTGKSDEFRSLHGSISCIQTWIIGI